ncbi:ABC transporter substrate-binding protein [Celeribacter sp.]|uniref:ABC transporter substrate-binding protein n=1 Tax=Celeribacter sp. TaxID=1890673 RepID=UPI003A8CE49C
MFDFLSRRYRAVCTALCLVGGATAVSAETLALGFAGGRGPTDMPAVLALEALEASGWETEIIEFDSPDILTQALLSGQVQIAAMGPAAAFAADIAGADLRIVAKNNRNDFMILGASDVSSCDEFDGRVVAIHSTGSATTAHLSQYMEDTCPDAEPNLIVLSGSANRVAALLNGQIDGTIVRMEDWMAITGGEDERAHILVKLVEEQPTLLTQAIVVSARNVDDSRTAVEAFVAALDAEFEAIYADPEAFAAEASSHLKEIDPGELAAVYQALADAKMFPLEKGLSYDQVVDTISFYEAAGKAEPGQLTPELVADFSFSGQ